MRSTGSVRIVYLSAIIIAASATQALAETGAGPSTRSSVSAAVVFQLPALESALDELVPRRLASFDDRGSECWHRVIFGREIHVDCAYEGYIERTGGVRLSTDEGKINGEIPIYGTVSARGVGRFVRRLHGSTEARLTAYASARPRLLPDWSVALDMHEGFRWRESPVVRVLGFPIDLARYAEPAIERQLARVKERVEANVRGLDIRRKAEQVWKQMFSPVALSDNPKLWLRVTPESVAFSGLRATGHELDGTLEISGTAEAVLGNAPAPSQPTPLPALGSEVSNPGQFSVDVPIDLPFTEIVSSWKRALGADPQFAGKLSDIDIAPSDGKLAITLHLGGGQGAGDLTKLLAGLKAGTDGQTIGLDILSDTSVPQLPLNLGSLPEALRISLKDRLDALTTSANQRLNQQLADGFRREGQLAAGNLGGVSILSDRIRVIANAHGNLRFVYGR